MNHMTFLEIQRIISNIMTLKSIAKYCQNKLTRSARQYLSARGVTDKSIQTFELGYCPFDIDEFVESLGKDNLKELGVVFETEDGDIRTFVRNTVTFPFVNQYNKVVSVSFRPMQPNEVIKSKNLRKYWHISFAKSLFLYGLRQAIPVIRKKRQVIVVEGQFDVIMSHQHDIVNTVGVGGTALSAQQVKILSRFAREIVVVFDGDPAGQRALEKVKQRELENIMIKTVRLPDGEDVDSFLQSYGKDGYLRLLSEAA